MSTNLQVLDDVSYGLLIKNRELLIDYINFTDEFISLCLEKKVVSGENVLQLKMSDNNAGKVDAIINTLRIKTTKYFDAFIDILTITNHVELVSLVKDNNHLIGEDEFHDIWKQVPSLKKINSKSEQMELINYLQNKFQTIYNRSILEQQKGQNSKVAKAHKSQIEQSWKFDKQTINKDKETGLLKDQIKEIEEELFYKQSQLHQIQEELISIKKLKDDQLEIADKFNLANNKELQRSEYSLNVYKQTVANIRDKLRQILLERAPSSKDLIRQMSSSNIEKWGDEKYVGMVESSFEKLLDMFENLLHQKYLYDELVKDVQFAICSVFGYPQFSDISVTDAALSYMRMTDEKIALLNHKLRTAEGFIFNELSNEEIPKQYKDVKLNVNERLEYEKLIGQLQKRIKSLQQQLIVKDKEFETMSKMKDQQKHDIYMSRYKDIQIRKKELKSNNMNSGSDLFAATLTNAIGNNNNNNNNDNKYNKSQVSQINEAYYPRPRTPRLMNSKVPNNNKPSNNRNTFKTGLVKFL